jgi:hypothetical protein
MNPEMSVSVHGRCAATMGVVVPEEAAMVLRHSGRPAETKGLLFTVPPSQQAVLTT